MKLKKKKDSGLDETFVTTIRISNREDIILKKISPYRANAIRWLISQYKNSDRLQMKAKKDRE